MANQVDKKDFNLLESEVADKQSKIIVTDNVSHLDRMSENQIIIVRQFDAIKSYKSGISYDRNGNIRIN